MSSDLRQQFRLGTWQVDPATGSLTGQNGEAEHLEPKVMDVLMLLADHAGQLVSRDQLLDGVWGGNMAADELLTGAISELRRTLKDNRRDPQFIETISKRGYRLIGNVHLPDGNLPEIDSFPNVSTTIKYRARLTFAAIGVLAALSLLLFADRIATPPGGNSSIPVVSNYTQLTQSRFVMPPMPSPYPIIPDASRIYFNDFDLGRLGLRQVSQQGGEAVRIDTSAAISDAEFHPLAIMPGQSSLALNRVGMDAPGIPFELWSFPLVGGTPRQLGRAGDAAFSPDGTLVAFESELGVISVANADLSEPRELARMLGRVHWIRFSPDGKRLRYTLYTSTAPFSMSPHLAIKGAILEIDVDGGEPTPVFPQLRTISHCCGVWTPDSTYFVFQAVHNYRTQLWAANPAIEESPRQITASALEFRRPAISPDGKKIFAVSWHLRGEIATFDQRVESFVPMRGFESISADQLSFSRSGDRVAYVTYPEGNLWVSSRDGSDHRQLTFSPMRVAEPAWSPDGQRIAFVGSTPDSIVGVYVVSGNGGPAQPVGDETVARAFPGWSADSTRIVHMQADTQLLVRTDIHSGVSVELPGTEGLVAPRLSPGGTKVAARSQEGLVVMDLESGSRRVVSEDMIKQQWFYWEADGDHLFLVDFFVKGNERTIWRLNIESGDIDKVAVIGNTPTAWGDVGMWVGIDPESTPIVLKDTSIHHIYALDWLR